MACDAFNLIGSQRCDLFTNRTILRFESHLFPSQGDSFTKKVQLNLGLSKEINQFVEIWEKPFEIFRKPAQ